jgi:hypothetical protein
MGGLVKAGKEIEQRRLATTGRPNDADKLTRPDAQAHILKSIHISGMRTKSA